LSWADRAGRLAAVLVCAGTLAACGSEPAPEQAAPADTGMAADATTRGLAEVEFARQCTVATANFADEADFDADLDTRLSAAGFSHEQWKQWHDALADSPGLVAQYAETSAAGCPVG